LQCRSYLAHADDGVSALEHVGACMAGSTLEHGGAARGRTKKTILPNSRDN
jgi:hypothetical protein